MTWTKLRGVDSSFFSAIVLFIWASAQKELFRKEFPGKQCLQKGSQKRQSMDSSRGISWRLLFSLSFYFLQHPKWFSGFLVSFLAPNPDTGQIRYRFHRGSATWGSPSATPRTPEWISKGPGPHGSRRRNRFRRGANQRSGLWCPNRLKTMNLGGSLRCTCWRTPQI